MNTLLPKKTLLALALLICFKAEAGRTGGSPLANTRVSGNPSFSYAGPQTYIAGKAVSPLSPTGGGAAAPAYSSSTTTLGPSFSNPGAVAVDSKGNIFIAVRSTQVIQEIPGGTGAPVTIATGLTNLAGIAVDAQENIYITDQGNSLVKELPLVSGTYGTPVTLGPYFTFKQPTGLAVDAQGNVYVADAGNNAVEKIFPGNSAYSVVADVVTVGSGFATPTGIAVDTYGNVYVVDSGNNAVKEIPAAGGAPVAIGTGFKSPYAVAIDGSGNVIVADYGNNLVKEIPANGGAIMTIGSGWATVTGVAVDNANNVYVTDNGTNSLQKVQPAGGYYISSALPKGLSFNNTTGTINGTPIITSPTANYVVTAYNGAYGSISTTLTITVNGVTMSYAGPQVYTAGIAISPLAPAGTAAPAPAYSSSATYLGSGVLYGPGQVAIDSKGNIFVSSISLASVIEIPIGNAAPFTIISGLDYPLGLAVDAQDNVYVADPEKNTISEYPLVGGTYGAAVILGSGFKFYEPNGVAVDSKGNVYVSDFNNNAVEKISAGGGAAFVIGAGFKGPYGVAVDSNGNVYVADFGNQAVKKIPAGGGTPVTLGSGFSGPQAVAVDGTGNVFVNDSTNPLTLKEIPANGGAVITLLSGSNTISGMAIDYLGNLYGSNASAAQAVQKIRPVGGYYISPALPQGLSFSNTTGTISGTPVVSSPATDYLITAYNAYGGNSTTVNITVNALSISYASPQVYTAGTGITALAPTASGVTSPAYSSSPATATSGLPVPTGVAVDRNGNIFVSDQSRNLVEEYPAGGGAPDTIGTGFYQPQGLAVDAADNVYVADHSNNLVKKIPFVNGKYTAPVAIGTDFTFVGPYDVAIDITGNVYVANIGGNSIVEIPGDGSPTFIKEDGFNAPDGVAVDAYGNVYVADYQSRAIEEIPAAGGAIDTLASGLTAPSEVRVDGTGNVFFTDGQVLKEVRANSGTLAIIISGQDFLFGLAIDKANNLFVADQPAKVVVEISPVGGYYINPALSQGLSFNTATGAIAGTPLVTSPPVNYTVTAYNTYGSNSAILNITVNAVPLNYTNPQVYTAGTAISPLKPSSGISITPAYGGGITTKGSGFSSPVGLAVDVKGNVFVADQASNLIKEIPGGTGTPVTVSGGFNTPVGVAVDAQGNLYVADEGDNLVKEIPLSNGVYGTPVAIGANFAFNQPYGVAVDSKGNVYVADNLNNAVEEIPVGGGAVFAIGSGFSTPKGVAVDAYGNVYVADYGNSAVKEITVGGGNPVTVGSGFSSPYNVAIDGSGNVFVTDYSGHALKEIPVNGGAIMTIRSGESVPLGIAVDNVNNLYLTFHGSNNVAQIQPVGGYYISPALPQGLSFNNTTGAITGTPVVGSPSTSYLITVYNGYGSNSTTINLTVNALTIGYTSPQVYTAGATITPLTPTGIGVAAPAYSTSSTTLGSGFNAPDGVAVDSKGNVFVGDQNNQAVKEIPGGTGTPVVIATGFSEPDGVAVDAQGNVYVADQNANQVEEIPLVSGAYGAPVAIGSGFTFNRPYGVAVDARGNVYVADSGNGAIDEIPAGGGAVVVIASGFDTPLGVAVDAYENIYVADYNHSLVKKIPAGGGTPVILGTGFDAPSGVSVDGSGNLFVADYGNKMLKEIPANGGAIITIASGYTNIVGIAIDSINNVYVTGNNAVNKIQPVGGYYISPALPQGLVFSNTTGIISGMPALASPPSSYLITAYNGYGYSSTTVNITINALTFSYAGPQAYSAGVAVTPLAPTGGSAAAPAYSTITTTLGSGFSSPEGVAVDSKGNVFIADDQNQVVKEIPGGTGTPVVIASGFISPVGLAVDALGNVYVADESAKQVKEIPLVSGAYGAPVAIGSGFTFNEPFGLAVDAKGDVYVGDYGYNAIEEIPADGGPVATIASGFNYPLGVSVDVYGNIYVADYNNNAVKKIPAGGGAPVTVGSGFNMPISVAVDGSGNLFVADSGNKMLKEIPVNGGAILTVGSGYSYLHDVAVDGVNNIYVTDFNVVKKVQPIGGYYMYPALPQGLIFNNTTGIISGTPVVASPPSSYLITAYNGYGSSSTTVNIAVSLPLPPSFSYSSPQTYAVGVAITPLSPTSSDVLSPAYSVNPVLLGSGFSSPSGIATDAAGNIYIADYGHKLLKKLPAGSNTPITIGSGFTDPFAVAVDAAGDVYVADYGASAVYKVPAGNGTPVTIGSGFSNPSGVAVDAAGNVFVADHSHNLIKKIPAGSNTPVSIGSGFSLPISVAVDAAGNVYVGDKNNNAVKEIPAGSNTPVSIGSGFSSPYGVAVDASGNVYVDDYGNNAIKEIPAGSTTPVTIGSGFKTPEGIAVDGAGNLYVADAGNNAVKKIIPTGGYYISSPLPQGLTINNSTGIISGTPMAASAANNYTVTGYNTSGSGAATVNIEVASNNANLSSLVLSSGPLTPVFAAGTTGYTTAVANTISQLTVTPTTADNTATVAVNGTTVTSGTASAPITLSVGANIINVVVTAQNNSTQTYTVKVTRAASTNATLSNIILSAGTLTPVFASGTTDYTATVPYLTTAVTLEPVAGDPGATIKVNGTTVTNNIASGAIALAVGTNTVTTVVTAPDGVTTQTYTVTVTRSPKSSVATLAGITASKGTLSPAFASGTTSYTVMETNGTTSVTITPTTTDATATVKVNGTAVASGKASGAITLAVGNNTVTIVTTAQDGTTTDTYTLNVIRPSTNAKLASLAINAGTLSPVFNTNTTSYTATEVYAQSSVKLTPTVTVAGATVSINGTAVASGATSGFLVLKVGANNINIVVTAQDGVTTDMYTLTVTRAAASTNAALSNIVLSKGTLTPAFVSTTLSYSVMEANGTTSVTLTPTTADATATVAVNGTAVTSGKASAAITLAVGNNTIPVVVTAQDGATKQTYTVNVVRPSTNAKLAGLTISNGTLTPAFNTNTTTYTASVANTISAVTVTPTIAAAGATVTVNGSVVASGSASAGLALTVGSNTITMVVTAQDGVTTDTYTLTVTRATGGENIPDATVSVDKPTETPKLAEDGITVHQAISPNGDGINDFLQIDNISQSPDNKLSIMDRNGRLVFEAKGYDNATKVFDGHSNKTGQMQLPGTYFYELDYTVNGITKHKTGYLVLKY